MTNIDEIMKQLKENTEVKKAGYFFSAMGDPYYNINEETLLKKGYFEKISSALEEIKIVLEQEDIKKHNIVKYFEDNECFLSHLLDSTELLMELVILKYLTKSINEFDVFTVPLESIPEIADSKYKIVMMDSDNKPNHQGIYYGANFYFYSPIYNIRRDATEPSMLMKQLFKERDSGNELSLRLDESISVKKKYYKPTIKLLHELHHGKVLDLSNIDLSFPLNSGKQENLCVYNPDTMKKIQFKISHRKDSELWVEVEELYTNDIEQDMHITRYLHSIYDPSLKKFVHIDGSFNIYYHQNYVERLRNQISAHANLHLKHWLIEGNISVLDWQKLIFYFFEDNDLILDAFTSKLVDDE